MTFDDMAKRIIAHYGTNRRGTPNLTRVQGDFHHLIGTNPRGEGIFLVWRPTGDSCMGREDFLAIAAEARLAGLSRPWHVYATHTSYMAQRVVFHQIVGHAFGEEVAP